MKRYRNLVIANWKMNPNSLGEAKEIFGGTRRAAARQKNTDVVICPPAVFINNLTKTKKPKNLSIGSQNIFQEEKGAFTGEVSGEMIKNLGVTHVLVGHSERRAMGDNDAIVNKKMLASINVGLIPILCIGEKERDKEGLYLEFVRQQLKVGLLGLQKKDLVGIIVAYEPIWAIGRSYREAMNPTDVHEMTLFIKKSLGGLFGQDIGNTAKILYGGAVEAENSAEMMKLGNVQGFLVGHASLVPEQFGEILMAADKK